MRNFANKRFRENPKTFFFTNNFFFSPNTALFMRHCGKI